MNMRIMLLLLLTSVSGCKKAQEYSTDHYFVAEAVHLLVPRQPGWVKDNATLSANVSEGGIVLRLVRESSVAGSPRIDVVLEGPREQPTVIEEFLTRNLREMGQL